MIDMASADLRYMQITITPEAGAALPGWALLESFSSVEFLSHINTVGGNMRCLIRVEYEDEAVLTQTSPSLEVLDVIEKSQNAALLEVVAKGPLPRVFAALEHVWWVTPTYLSSHGFTVTIRGTKEALRAARKGLSELLGESYKMKLGAQSAHTSNFLELLPEKQRNVLDEAIKMGYYDRPRRCTQRAIAEALNIKQATVSEHLQSAESAIIHSFVNDH
ncbi:MAG TPA: helix-turn-helix domain-containing protein [Candidatus Poseidoniales archaeon]|nr:MAG TPA: helix-turn-helix domain-containing protein [Candidatus Poseidoniales archaeon]HII20078.1 helix-turn-helix domain-containing protein [Poseidonia sp.]|tara:strand:- start:166 stop:822 length:657 start_codon:yes stop_codon:yes gene_type:complete